MTLKKAIKKSDRNLVTTRLETWAMPGVPDVLLCDEKGLFHFIELKATGGRAVELRPHQVSWLSKHQHSSSWILVRKVETKTIPQQVYLYRAESAMDLKMEGLDVEPVEFQEKDFDWDKIINLITPI